MNLWFEIVVIALLTYCAIIAMVAAVAAVTHESPDTSSITDALTRQSHDLAMIYAQQKSMDIWANARHDAQVREREMIHRMFTDGVHLSTEPAKKPLSDADVKKILGEARLTFVEAPKNASK